VYGRSIAEALGTTKKGKEGKEGKEERILADGRCRGWYNFVMIIQPHCLS
jgi:hypothetical protein